MLGENMSPLNNINGFKLEKLLMAVANRAAPPTGSFSKILRIKRFRLYLYMNKIHH